MKYFKSFGSFLNEASDTTWNGEWKVEIWSKPPGAPEWELIDTKEGFKDEKEAQAWAGSQKQGKDVSYDIAPVEGWIDPMGTWHSDDDEDPAAAYESVDESYSPEENEIAQYFDDAEIKLTPKFSLKAMSEYTGEDSDVLAVLLCNLVDEEVMKDIAKGDYSTFDSSDSSQFNDDYDSMMDEFRLRKK